MDIFAAITATTQAIEIAKGLRQVEKAYDEAALKIKISDLVDSLVDVKSALQDARDEKAALEGEIARLNETLKRRDDTVVAHGFRYTADPGDKSKPVGPPFCPRCDEVDKRLILCVKNPKDRGVICPQCKAEYGRGAMNYLWPDQQRELDAMKGARPDTPSG